MLSSKEKVTQRLQGNVYNREGESIVVKTKRVSQVTRTVSGNVLMCKTSADVAFLSTLNPLLNTKKFMVQSSIDNPIFTLMNINI